MKVWRRSRSAAIAPILVVLGSASAVLTFAQTQPTFHTEANFVRVDVYVTRRALEQTPTPIHVGPLVPRHEPDILRWLEAL